MKNKKSTISRFVIPLSLMAVIGMALTFSPTAGATLITWQSPVAININDATQIATTGTLVLAVSATDSSYTVNGVGFSPTLGTYVSNLTGGALFTGGTTDYAKLIQTGYYRSSAGTATIAIPSLTIGKQYEVQLFTPFWNADFQSAFSDGANSVNMGNTATTPTYVIGTFTADATTKDISFNAASGSAYGLLAALEVRDITVPEPSTVLLFGLGGLLLWRRSRKLAVQ